MTIVKDFDGVIMGDKSSAECGRERQKKGVIAGCGFRIAITPPCTVIGVIASVKEIARLDENGLFFKEINVGVSYR